MTKSLYAQYVKRVLDVVLAGLVLIILSPLLMVVAIAIRIEDGGPALFTQRRVGRGGELFTLFKFRSMEVGVPSVASVDATQLRLTRVGRAIRRTNVDELPQLINVLTGDMSLVGPRPALVSQTRLNELRAASGVWSIRPGLTGLAQVCSYDGMPVEEKAALDAHYLSTLGSVGDLIIVGRTFAYLLRRPPVY